MTKTIYSYDLEIYSMTMDYQKIVGHIIAESAQDAHTIAEDLYALKYDVEPFELFIDIYCDDKLVLKNGYEPQEYLDIMKKLEEKKNGTGH